MEQNDPSSNKRKKIFKAAIIAGSILLIGLTIFIFIRANEMLVEDLEAYEQMISIPEIREKTINEWLDKLETSYTNLNKENQTTFESEYYEIVETGKDYINQFNEWRTLVESNKPELFNPFNTVELSLLFMELELKSGEYAWEIGKMKSRIDKAQLQQEKIKQLIE